ncbi:MAG TPA: type II toxin-antitoxin system MqsA family antitoxin [bacterium]|jgi:DNA-binding transcriptional regulator YiaG|nr:type II toxin-antitoxin system MqsA family antitoxin [bacterium]
MRRFKSKMILGLTPIYVKQVAQDLTKYERTGKLDPKRFKVVRVVVPAKPKEIREVRKVLGLDRAKLAQVLGVSVETIRSYEQGRRSPDGPVTKLLRFLSRYPALVSKFEAA